MSYNFFSLVKGTVKSEITFVSKYVEVLYSSEGQWEPELSAAVRLRGMCLRSFQGSRTNNLDRFQNRFGAGVGQNKIF